MLDGLLLFTVLDVWRVLLPLGLLFVSVGTLGFQRVLGFSQETGLNEFLLILIFRVSAALFGVLAVVGLIVPWVLAYHLPEAHLAEGPWGYEEIIVSIIGLGFLWSLHQRIVHTQMLRGTILIATLLLFGGAAILWTARWDVMANVGHISGGWFLGNSVEWEWARLFPKVLHLFFSSFVAAGMVVVGLGVFGVLNSGSEKKSSVSSLEKNRVDLIRYGVGWMLSGLVPQILIGPWLFLLLPERPQLALIEGTSLTSIIFFLSLTVALLALVLLNATFMVPHVRGLVWGGWGNAALALAMMSIVRYETFVGTLYAHHIPFAIAELSLWHVLSVFVLLAFLGVLLIGWCVCPAVLIFRTGMPTPQLDKPCEGH